MSGARFLVGDTRDRLAQLADGTVDLILTSPPFLALRSYLPDGHPDKGKEIGSEATPAAYLEVLLGLTAEWGRVLAPHGSIAVELGDTYAVSGGAGGDYDEDGLRDSQQRFNGAAAAARAHAQKTRTRDPGPGWPLAKSLACIPQLYQVALAYGINPLTGQASPAGKWRIRNLKPWIRSNPPVGALGDKERPATSYVIVACRASDRWFDLDAVRVAHQQPEPKRVAAKAIGGDQNTKVDQRYRSEGDYLATNAGGAPPRDWWHHVDAVLDAELAARAGKPNGSGGQGGSGVSAVDGGTRMGHRFDDGTASSVGAQGVHLRRALERAGILTTREALDVSPRGYTGAHYAVWPPELVRLLVDEMCPRRVCIVCGEPSRRIVERSERYAAARAAIGDFNNRGRDGKGVSGSRSVLSKAAGADMTAAEHITVGWSDCGCLPQSAVGEGMESGETGSTRPTDRTEPRPPTSPTPGHWRPGHILDPFAGSGTTLAVATGMGRDATGIDIDERNAHLAQERCGMFLDIDYGTRKATIA